MKGNRYRWWSNQWVWWSLFIVWLLAVFLASTMTGREVQVYLPNALLHKLAHFIAYSSGAMILALSLRFSTKWSWPIIAGLSVLLVSLYGATDEWHQTFTTGRNGAMRDWMIDTASGLIGVGVLWLLKKGLAAGQRRED